MKKTVFCTFSLLLAFVFCVSAFALTGDNFVSFDGGTSTTIPTGEHIAGDVDGNGKVNLYDAIALLRYIGGETKYAARDAVDTTGDGKTDIADVLTILRYTVGTQNGIGELVPGTN